MMNMIARIKRGIVCVWYFTLGNVIAHFMYNRKYLKGQCFKFKGVGWKWVVTNFLFQALFRINAGVPWPVSPRVLIGDYKNIEFDPNDMHNFQSSGVYFQAVSARLVIGKGTWIAPNVGLITSNHDLNDPSQRAAGKDVILGEKCWIGMGSVILPGVVLGPHTTVGAGSIVTKSFPEGYCVIAGNPAKIIKRIPKQKS